VPTWHFNNGRLMRSNCWRKKLCAYATLKVFSGFCFEPLQPILVLASDLRVVSANPAACSLLNKDLKRFTGRTFTDIFDAEGAKAIQAWLSKALALGRGDEIRATLAEGEQEITVFASIFRQDGDSYYLVRLSPVVEDRRSSGAWSSLVGIVEDLPMGFVVTDLNQRIRIANPAFLDFVELVSLEQVRGERLDKWLGRPGIDLDAIVTTLRNRGAVQNFTTIMRGDHGSLEEVEITAVKTADSFGFSVRRIPKHIRDESRGSRELLRGRSTYEACWPCDTQGARAGINRHDRKTLYRNRARPNERKPSLCGGPSWPKSSKSLFKVAPLRS